MLLLTKTAILNSESEMAHNPFGTDQKRSKMASRDLKIIVDKNKEPSVAVITQSRSLQCTSSQILILRCYT